ncbi:MAG: M23 family metallopeptidase [Acaryochloris sp. CRU_2_0]|nr:M23 family metallopeptidase [Acaryochloris sp. CRU_2_0]
MASGDFATADQVLGAGQFTSLPGGIEASRHWSDPGKLEQYGPNGQAPDVGTAPLPTSPGGMPCSPATVAGVPGEIGPEGDGVATGRLKNPLPGATVTSEFGPRVPPAPGASSFHAAVDLAMPSGTPILAADGGVVEYAGWKGGYGNYILINHGNGLATWYGHNQANNVRVGQKVTAGQHIGMVGSTGISTGPHVDFGVVEGYKTGSITSGQAVDPRKHVRF